MLYHEMRREKKNMKIRDNDKAFRMKNINCKSILERLTPETARKEKENKWILLIYFQT